MPLRYVCAVVLDVITCVCVCCMSRVVFVFSIRRWTAHLLSHRMRRLQVVAPDGSQPDAVAQPSLSLFSLQNWKLSYFDKSMVQDEAGTSVDVDRMAEQSSTKGLIRRQVWSSVWRCCLPGGVLRLWSPLQSVSLRSLQMWSMKKLCWISEELWRAALCWK